VLLPASAWAEVDGTFTNGKGIVQRVRTAVEPPGEARPHRELIALIAKRLGVDVGPTSAKAVFAEMKKSVPDFADASFGREFLPIQLRFAGSRG
jgi:predicted molibdopterin-dependent oxidoreductase YjgC